jgi:hypothetical protein
MLSFRAWAAACAGCAALVVATAAGASADASVTKAYYLPVAPAAVPYSNSSFDCAQPDTAPMGGIGGTCFAIQSGKLDITVTDTTGIAQGARVVFWDSAGNIITDTPNALCGSAKNVAVPDGASVLWVEPGEAPLEGACGTPAPGSFGTITITGTGVPTGAGASRPRDARASRPAASHDLVRAIAPPAGTAEVWAATVRTNVRFHALPL